MSRPMMPTHDFEEITQMIAEAKQRANLTVNSVLVELYWKIGQYIDQKLATSEWGDEVVGQLSHHLQATQTGLRGFSRPNLFRMRQFYVTYRDNEKVSPLVAQLPWTHNLIIVSQSKTPEEREFYLRTAIREKWTKRELERQLKGALFERVVLSPPKVSPAVRLLHPP